MAANLVLLGEILGYHLAIISIPLASILTKKASLRGTKQSPICRAAMQVSLYSSGLLRTSQ
jgi:hypothetical protein